PGRTTGRTHSTGEPGAEEVDVEAADEASNAAAGDSRIRAITAATPLNPMRPARFGNTCRTFLKSPHAHTASTFAIAPTGIRRKSIQPTGGATFRPGRSPRTCPP